MYDLPAFDVDELRFRITDTGKIAFCDDDDKEAGYLSVSAEIKAAATDEYAFGHIKVGEQWITSGPIWRLIANRLDEKYSPEIHDHIAEHLAAAKEAAAYAARPDAMKAGNYWPTPREAA